MRGRERRRRARRGIARDGTVGVEARPAYTVPSLKKALHDLRGENGGEEPAGLILDLRFNSGGLLQQAWEMADLFLRHGELYWIAVKGREKPWRAKDDRHEPSYPIIVLANELSASGAEIVIGALQKNHRAVVLGTSTFVESLSVRSLIITPILMTTVFIPCPYQRRYGTSKRSWITRTSSM